jgi:DNA-binding transcriptional regulator WhiA
VPRWRNGRRCGLKIRFSQGSEGSSPSRGTQNGNCSVFDIICLVKEALTAYIIGVSLGDGNLSKPNGRATRLRITCDNKYPQIKEEIIDSLQTLFPDNRVSIVASGKYTYCNISVYSNRLDEIIPWKVGEGSKFEQQAMVPDWIKEDKEFAKHCLRGLLQTDGSIYKDRGYLMVNFTNNTLPLVNDAKYMMEELGFYPKLYKAKQKSTHPKYTVRLAKSVGDFIELIGLYKS